MKNDPYYFFKNKITHPKGRVLTDKVNYFADYFQFSISNWGNSYVQKIENHKSVLEKIKFHLENYSKFSIPHIKRYFSCSFFKKEDFMMKIFYSEYFKKINYYRNTCVDFSVEETRVKSIREISEFIEILNQTLFINAINSLINIFLCDKPLKQHSHCRQINYYTSIIIAEFFYTGFTQKDLDSLFNRILDKEITLDNFNNITNAPLPTELHLLNNNDTKDEYINKVTEYLKNRTFQQQFLGMYYFYKNEQKMKTFVLKLDHARSSEEVNLSYGKVLFSNTLHHKYVNNQSRKEYASFFSDKEIVLVQVSVQGINHDVAYKKALREIELATNYFNIVHDSKAKVNPKEFVIKDDFLNQMVSSLYYDLIKNKAQKFDEGNIYKMLKVDTPLSTRLKELEPIYITGFVSDYMDEKITSYWRYLECFFIDGNSTIEKVSKIIANYSSYQDKRFFVMSLARIYSSLNFINQEEMQILGREKYNELGDLFAASKVESKIFRISEIFNHPFLHEMISSYYKKSKYDKIEFNYDFLKQILMETYEQRNFIHHAAKYNEMSVSKILLTLETIIHIFRWKLIESVNESKFESFEKILEALSATDSYEN